MDFPSIITDMIQNSNVIMKKISILAALLLLAGTSAFAQMSVGAGYVNSTTTLKLNKDGEGSTTPVNGFYAGVGYTLPLSSLVSFTPGLYYELLAEQDSNDLFGLDLSGTRVEHYINVPLTFSIGAELAPALRLFAFAGPTATFGLASTTDSSIKAGSAFSIGGKTDNYDGTDYGRFNVMIGGGAGIAYGNVRLTVGYDYGLLNRYTGSNENLSRMDSRFHVGLGFAF